MHSSDVEIYSGSFPSPVNEADNALGQHDYSLVLWRVHVTFGVDIHWNKTHNPCIFKLKDFKTSIFEHMHAMSSCATCPSLHNALNYSTKVLQMETYMNIYYTNVNLTIYTCHNHCTKYEISPYEVGLSPPNWNKLDIIQPYQYKIP